MDECHGTDSSRCFGEQIAAFLSGGGWKQDRGICQRGKEFCRRAPVGLGGGDEADLLRRRAGRERKVGREGDNRRRRQRQRRHCRCSLKFARLRRARADCRWTGKVDFRTSNSLTFIVSHSCFRAMSSSNGQNGCSQARLVIHQGSSGLHFNIMARRLPMPLN